MKRSPQVIRYVVLLLIDCTALVLTFIFNSRDVCNMWNLVWIPDQTQSELSFEESARVWWYEQLDLFNITRIQMWGNPAKLYRKKAPKKGIEKEEGARTQVQASKQPKRGEPQGGKGTTKNRTLHQTHEKTLSWETEARFQHWNWTITA